jgi:large subunit ribosomal protein L1
MPNPKMGTVTKDITKAVKTAKAGVVQFKVEKKGIIQAGVGKKSFSDEALLDNVRSFMVSVYDAKPDGLKGKYMRRAHISSTMGPGIEVELPSIDPSSARFMLNLNP